MRIQTMKLNCESQAQGYSFKGVSIKIVVANICLN